MKASSQSKPALDLVEEATHLLRTAAVGTLALYYVGTAPFVLALLYFWADMSRNPFAEQHLADAAFAVAALFVWMKFWQALFARRVRARLAGGAPAPLRAGAAFRVAVVQTTLQPVGLLPIGLCISASVYSPALGLLLAFAVGGLLPLFYTITTVGDGTADTVSEVFKKAWRLWMLWPKQSLALLVVLYLFGFCVFLSLSVFCGSLPGVLQTLFGVQSVFTQSLGSLFNSTFFAAMFGLAYLCVDPILKTVYTLRCFYGESLKSGEDLKAELKRFSPSAQAVFLAVMLLATMSGAQATLAADDATTANPPIEAPAGKTGAISSPDLDHAIDQTIHQRKYTWRMPREATPKDTKQGAIGRFFDKVAEMLRKALRSARDWLQKVSKKLFPRRNISHSYHDPGEWMTSLQALLFVLITVVVCALAIFIYRLWQGKPRLDAVASDPVQKPVPDIGDENVGADQMPEDGWTRLGRELLERGEFRLALRAFYLASLAYLAQRSLITLARFKSNHDYERELRRRGHSFPVLLSIFGDNLPVFERIWYGRHDVNGEMVNDFAANVERMKGAA